MIDVLLLDGQYRQTLTALRTYARHGLRVGTVACEPDAWWAPSLKSRWASMTAVAPDLATNRNGYFDCVMELVCHHQPRMLLPAHDGSIEAIRSRRRELEACTALPLGSEQALDVAVSKEKTLALAAELGIAIPRGVRVRQLDDLPSALREVGLPAVIKPLQSWHERDGGSQRISTWAVQSIDEAREAFDWIFSVGAEALLQQWLPGRREAVTLMYAQDRFWARVAQVSHREWPVLGGVSVLCETIPLLPDITRQSEQLLRAINLEGCSMVEFRRDAEGRPVLMEINPRMGGSVALPLAAGVDFPWLLYDWKVNGKLRAIDGYQVGRRLRWLPGDVWNLKCVFGQQGQPDVPPRGQAAATFLLDFLRPSTLDGFQLTDLRPTLAEFDNVVLRHMFSRVRKFVPRT